MAVSAVSPADLLDAPSACLSEDDERKVDEMMVSYNEALRQDWNRSGIGLRARDVTDVQIAEIVRRFESARPVPWRATLHPMLSDVQDKAGNFVPLPQCYVIQLVPDWRGVR